MYDVGREGLSALDVSRFPIHNGDIVLFSFGEKDCRCLIHQFRENWRQAIDEMVERYFSLIRTNVSKFSDLNVLVYNVRVCAGVRFGIRDSVLVSFQCLLLANRFA